MSKLAKEIMTPAPQCCSADTTLNDVANLMVEADCGEIPVTDGSNRLIGVVTDRDIVVRAVAKGKNPSATTAGECMTEPVVVVNEDTTLADEMAVMEENQIRRVPVLDRDQRLVGIVSLGDLAVETQDQHLAGQTLEGVSEPGKSNR